MFKKITIILSLIVAYNSFASDLNQQHIEKKVRIEQEKIQEKYGSANLPEEIYVAAANNDIAKVKQYLDVGGNINGVYICYTLLITAVINGHVDLVKFLIGAGANVDFVGNNALGYTPLIHAATQHILELEKKYAEIAEILIKSGADINYESYYGTALIHAVDRQNIEVVKVLLKNKANTLIKSKHDKTAYIMAVESLVHWTKKFKKRPCVVFSAATKEFAEIVKLIFDEYLKQDVNKDLITNDLLIAQKIQTESE